MDEKILESPDAGKESLVTLLLAFVVTYYDVASIQFLTVPDSAVDESTRTKCQPVDRGSLLFSMTATMFTRSRLYSGSREMCTDVFQYPWINHKLTHLLFYTLYVKFDGL